MPRSALDLVTRFRGLVEREIGSDLQISDYCKILKVNPARLSQACKALLGLTPISVVHEQKPMPAKRKLTYWRISDGEYGYQLGFQSPDLIGKESAGERGVS